MKQQNLNLLAFAGRATSFPGIENANINIIESNCGYESLSASGDSLRSEAELLTRKRLYQYAARYNVLVFAVCKKRYSTIIIKIAR